MNTEKLEASVIKAAIFLGILGFISLNIYLPAIPAIARDFNVKTTALKSSITLFLIGFSASQFYWGSLSTKYGRKKAIFHGLILANIGTLMAIFSPTLYFFNCARLIEGTGIGCASVLCRALLTDALSTKPNRLSWALSLVVSLANVMPALAPLIGGYLVIYLNWRAVFVLLLVYTLTLTILIERKITETNTNIHYNLTFKHAVLEYIQVLHSRKFIGYVLPYLALGGGMIGYYAATPFIFITYLHILPQNYSYLSIFTVSAYILGATISVRIRKYLSFDGTILLGIILACISALVFLILALISHLSVFTVILPIMIYLFGCGLVSPNANTCALRELSHIAGASAAVIASSIYAASALCTMFINNLDLSKLVSLAIYTMSISIIAIVSFYFLILHFNQSENKAKD